MNGDSTHISRLSDNPDDLQTLSNGGDVEVAHVLFMDIVAFTNLNMEQQRDTVSKLQQIVRETQTVSAASRSKSLISLPTGDGMALAFFGDPTLPLRCALEIAAVIGGLQLRMGVNTGPVYCISDVNGNRNVSGAGINVAQRIMDAGDAGHILLSKTTADILAQFGEWSPNLHDLGEHAVKHGVRLRFYSFYNASLGNRSLPSKFLSERKIVLHQWRSRAMIAAAIAVAVFVGIEANQMRLVPANSRRRSVAVLGFRNLTGRPGVDWISTDLSEGIRTQLAGNKQLRAISGQSVSDMNRDLNITRFDSLAGPTLTRIRKFGAELVIVGSYTDMNGRVTLNLELQDTEKEETIDALRADGEEADLSVLIAQVGTRLRRKLGVQGLSSERERQLAQSEPDPEAAPSYAEGLSALRSYDVMKAQNQLSQAAQVDPRFPFVHHYLASAWRILGYDSRARDEAKRAYNASSKLALEDRLIIEGSYWELSRDWEKAIVTYQQLHTYFPDQIEYALALARSQRLGGKLELALKGLERLQQSKSPGAEDPRIDLEKAEAAAAYRKYPIVVIAADTAAYKAKELGSKMLSSRALYWKCVGLRREKRYAEALPVCARAAELARGAGDRLGTARSLTGIGSCLLSQGNTAEAVSRFREAVQITQEIGTKLDEAGALNNLAFALMERGDLVETENNFRKAISIQQQIGIKSEELRSENGLCEVMNQEGKLPGAAEACRKAIVLASEVGDSNGLKIGLTELAAIEKKRGHSSAAAELIARASATGKHPLP